MWGNDPPDREGADDLGRFAILVPGRLQALGVLTIEQLDAVAGEVGDQKLRCVAAQVLRIVAGAEPIEQLACRFAHAAEDMWLRRLGAIGRRHPEVARRRHRLRQPLRGVVRRHVVDVDLVVWMSAWPM